MANEWISLEDCPPDIGEPVLCVGMSYGGEFLAPAVANLQEDGKFIIGYRFHDERVIGFFFETFPTHWMPLPAPPVAES